MWRYVLASLNALVICCWFPKIKCKVCMGTFLQKTTRGSSNSYNYSSLPSTIVISTHTPPFSLHSCYGIATSRLSYLTSQPQGNFHELITHFHNLSVLHKFIEPCLNKTELHIYITFYNTKFIWYLTSLPGVDGTAVYQDNVLADESSEVHLVENTFDCRGNKEFSLTTQRTSTYMQTCYQNMLAHTDYRIKQLHIAHCIVKVAHTHMCVMINHRAT